MNVSPTQFNYFLVFVPSVSRDSKIALPTVIVDTIFWELRVSIFIGVRVRNAFPRVLFAISVLPLSLQLDLLVHSITVTSITLFQLGTLG